MVTRMRLNLFLIIVIVLICFVLVFYDSESLNSLVIDYNDNFVIREVNIGEDEKKVEETKEEELKKDVEEVKVSFVNKELDNKWTFPIRDNYVITTYYGYGHNAIDIYAYSGYGSSILAANSGTVIGVYSGCYRGNLSCNGGGGNYVIIKHNTGNYYTIYMHLATIGVSVGDVVSSGQVIGAMGNTGRVIPAPSDNNPYGGTHLHFGVYIGEPYRGGYAINPFNLY